MSGEPPELDLLPPEAVVELLLAAEERVVPAVRSATPDIVAAARLLADAIEGGGRLVFAGAGTSGRLAVLEAAELPGTFGLDRDRVVGLLAGAGSSLAGVDADEDDATAGADDVRALGLGASDALVAVAVSGTTPYTVAAAHEAACAGAAVIAVVARADSALAAAARVAVVVDPGPEVLRDSTRLTAGTAHKVALDALTTTAMAIAGRVHGAHMIDVVAANRKLEDRVVGIVADIADRPPGDARSALEQCDWNARAAVVLLRHNVDADEAIKRAQATRTLREALRDSAD